MLLLDRAILIASMNAICRYLGLIEKTIYCHDDQPEQCAGELVEYIKKEFGTPKVALIGYQPAMLEKLAAAFSLWVVDLDPENIGKSKFGVQVEGYEATEEILKWCDLIVATGSTVVNSIITSTTTVKRNRHFSSEPSVLLPVILWALNAAMRWENNREMFNYNAQDY